MNVSQTIGSLTMVTGLTVGAPAAVLVVEAPAHTLTCRAPVVANRLQSVVRIRPTDEASDFIFPSALTPVSFALDDDDLSGHDTLQRVVLRELVEDDDTVW